MSRRLDAARVLITGGTGSPGQTLVRPQAAVSRCDVVFHGAVTTRVPTCDQSPRHAVATAVDLIRGSARDRIAPYYDDHGPADRVLKYTISAGIREDVAQ